MKNCALFHPPHIQPGQAGTSTLARLWWGSQLPCWDGVRGGQISDLDFRSYLEITKQHPQSQQRLSGAWTFPIPTWQWWGAPPPCSSGVRGGLVESKNFNHSPVVRLTLWCQWRLGGGGKEPGFYPLIAPVWWHFTSPLEWYQSKAAKTKDLNKIQSLATEYIKCPISVEYHSSYQEPGGSQTAWKKTIKIFQYQDDRDVTIIWQRF